MTSLADLERLLERVFERTSARVFRMRPQPVQLERRLERAMEHGRVSTDGQASVPDHYRVRLHPGDLQAVAAGDAEALARRLADRALAFARSHAYHLRDRPAVAIVADPSLSSGQVEVDAAFGDRSADSDAPPGPVREAEAEARPAGSIRAGGIRGGDPAETMVFRKPVLESPRAVLREILRDGRERTIEVDGQVMTIGRATDNGLVIDDGRVSRHHGRLQARRGALVYTDLGSTNGTRVNGIRVDEIVLGAGDRIELGDTVLVVETLPG
jgi:hypothetical protein